MSFSKKVVSTSALLLALAACGSSSSGPSSSSPDPAPEGPPEVTRLTLNIGTTSTENSANGLSFAAGDLFDVEDGFEGATVRLVRFISDNETGETFLQITEETITVTSFDDGDLSGTLTFNGEEITFLDGQATLPDGTRIDIFENTSGDWSATISPYSYVYDDNEGEILAPGLNTEGSFAVGFETNPGDMPTTSGTTQYRGGFNGYSTLLDLDGNVIENEVQFEGQAIINADFSDSRISGSLTFDTFADDADDIFVELELQEADIVGNGFATTANVVNGCVAVSCSSDTEIGGAFFGPNADETSGAAGVDYTETYGDGEGVRLVGAGGFTATLGGDEGPE
jgi:hypothetical protein